MAVAYLIKGLATAVFMHALVAIYLLNLQREGEGVLCVDHFHDLRDGLLAD